MRWKPTPAQLALVIDCATARLPFGPTAALLGISPMTLRVFLKRLQAVRGITGGTKDPESGSLVDEALRKATGATGA